MTSFHTHIADFGGALADGTIPATVVGPRVEFSPVESVTGRGKKNSWQIVVTLLDERGDAARISKKYLSGRLPEKYSARMNVLSRLEDGEYRSAETTAVDRGKNIGKSNETNALTQAIRNALGLYNRYMKTHQAISKNGPGETGRAAADRSSPARPGTRPPPMLIQKEGASREGTLSAADFARGIVAQRKFNGVRLVAHASAGRDGESAVDLYSGRTQNTYSGHDHIRDELAPVFRDYPDLYLDGEAYLHGKSLNWISGQARRDAPDAHPSDPLKYYVFDCFRLGRGADIQPESPSTQAKPVSLASEDRQQILDAIFSEFSFKYIVRVENIPVQSMDEVRALLAKFLAEGYEGVVLRKNWEPYQFSYSNYHSPRVLKIKPKLDDEFPITGFVEGKGKDKGAIIWVCKVTEQVAGDKYDPADDAFTVVPNMPIASRKKLYACLKRNAEFAREIVGKPLTVEYAEKSAKTGKPLQPKGVIIRTYENAEDSAAKIYRSCLDP